MSEIPIQKRNPDLLSLNDDDFVRAGSVEELVAEADILRGELGTLITDLRNFVGNLRKGSYGSIYPDEIADLLEEIIDG